MARFHSLIFTCIVVCMLFYVALSSKFDPPCNKWKNLLHNRCLKRGFTSGVTNCDEHYRGMKPVQELFWTKKKKIIRKCKRIHKLIRAHCSVYCSYTTRIVGSRTSDLDDIDMAKGFVVLSNDLTEDGLYVNNKSSSRLLSFLFDDTYIEIACDHYHEYLNEVSFWIRSSSKPNSNSFHFVRLYDGDNLNDVINNVNLKGQEIECQEMKEQLSTVGGILSIKVMPVREQVVNEAISKV